jgi:SAM-dependent methyltransferase
LNVGVVREQQTEMTSGERTEGAGEWGALGTGSSTSPICFLHKVRSASSSITTRRLRERVLERCALERVQEMARRHRRAGIAFREILRCNPSGRNVGIDLTEAMLERARARAEASGASYELVRGDASALSFPTARFSVVMSNNMLAVWPDCGTTRTSSFESAVCFRWQRHVTAPRRTDADHEQTRLETGLRRKGLFTVCAGTQLDFLGRRDPRRYGEGGAVRAANAVEVRESFLPAAGSHGPWLDRSSLSPLRPCSARVPAPLGLR